MGTSGGSRSGETRARAEAAEFLESHHAEAFLADREGAGEVARAFLEVCYADLGTRPDLIEEDDLRRALLELLPPKLDPAARASKQAVAIVRALLAHRFDAQPNANSWKLDGVLDEAATALPERLRSIGGTAAASGSSEPIRRPGSKLGRNDPCPCGSGKKFKRCCGKDA